VHYFGEINNYEMILAPTGSIAQNIWYKIAQQFPFVELDAIIIMPNHIHGILHIDHDIHKTGDAINRVSISTSNKCANPNVGGVTGCNNPMLYDNLSRVIRWYKGRVKYETTKRKLPFNWHSRFHDRILRIETNELNIKRNYIHNNPKNWKYDM